ncbi:MAG: hypothetical protein KGQ37_03905 [Hyphomicrobiales bacterium]|nr:hypothetical protein [Hyphomicrobiales bacterium]
MSLYALNLLKTPRSLRLFAPASPERPGTLAQAPASLLPGRKANLALGLAAALALLSIPVAPPGIIVSRASPLPPRPDWLQMMPLYARFDLPSPEFGAAKTSFVVLRQRLGHGLIERLAYRRLVRSHGVAQANWLRLSVITGVSGRHGVALDPQDQNPLAEVAMQRSIATAFGPMAVAKISSGCWAFHLQHDKPALQVNGTACPAVAAQGFDAGRLACVIGRLDYIGSSHHLALTRYFADAEVQRDQFCHHGHYQPQLSAAAKPGPAG